MAGFVVGTMSTELGFETKSVISAMSWHLTYYFTSRSDQGKVVGDTPSFYFTWRKFGEVPETLIDRSKQELKAYFKELFSETDVQVSKVAVNDSPNHYTLQFAVRVMHENQFYDLAEAVYVDGERFELLDKRRLG